MNLHKSYSFLGLPYKYVLQFFSCSIMCWIFLWLSVFLLFSFFQFDFLSSFVFSLLFHPFLSLFFRLLCFISSLPQFGWNWKIWLLLCNVMDQALKFQLHVPLQQWKDWLLLLLFCNVVDEALYLQPHVSSKYYVWKVLVILVLTLCYIYHSPIF
jgi:hypothetical protein